MMSPNPAFVSGAANSVKNAKLKLSPILIFNCFLTTSVFVTLNRYNTSSAYNNLTKRYQITQSMSRRGNQYDNDLAENFFSIFKTECIYGSKIKTFEKAKRIIDDYTYFYNHQRIQLKTKLTLRLSCEASSLLKLINYRSFFVLCA